MTTYRLPAAALDDHLDRLYVHRDSGRFEHVDGGHTMTVSYTHGGRSAVVEPSAGALAELLADMAYQVEFAEDGPYRAQCRRMIAAVRRAS